LNRIYCISHLLGGTYGLSRKLSFPLSQDNILKFIMFITRRVIQKRCLLAVVLYKAMLKWWFLSVITVGNKIGLDVSGVKASLYRRVKK